MAYFNRNILFLLIAGLLIVQAHTSSYKDLNIDDNFKAGIITPDKDIVDNAEPLSPAFIVFDNYDLILKWNRSLRFALAVCKLKNKFKDEL